MKYKEEGGIPSKIDTRRAEGKRTERDWVLISSINQITHSVRNGKRKREAQICDGHSSVICSAV